MRRSNVLANRKIVSWPVAGVALAASVAISLTVTAIVAAAQLGTVVLAEMSSLAVITAFTLLIWAAIQDGKPGQELALHTG
jgi:hypothetical protein